MTIAPTPSAATTTEPNELDQLIAATGNSYYRKPFEKFARDGRISATWNWAASFFGIYWVFRRGMFGYAAVYLVTGLIAFALTPPWLFAYFSIKLAVDPTIAIGDIAYRLVFSVASILVFPCYANAVYYRYLHLLLRHGKLETHAIGAGRPGTRATEILGYIVAAAIIALIASVVIPTYQEMTVRTQVTDVLKYGINAQTKIENYVTVKGRFPDFPREVDLGNISKPLHLREVRIDTRGVIRLVLTGPDLFAAPSLEGRSIVLTPILEAGKIASWRCSSDIPNGALPATCRK